MASSEVFTDTVFNETPTSYLPVYPSTRLPTLLPSPTRLPPCLHTSLSLHTRPPTHLRSDSPTDLITLHSSSTDPQTPHPNNQPTDFSTTIPNLTQGVFSIHFQEWS